jgi:polyisoprenoid-binding protein YceI
VNTFPTRWSARAVRWGALARRTSAAGALSLLLPAAAAAAGGPATDPALDWRLVLEPAASQIGFSLGATLHTVEGTFPLREGTLHFDPESGEVAGRVVIDAAAGETGIARRDEVMHEEVLESAAHPEFVLTPRAIRGVERHAEGLRGTLDAVLSIHGGTHELAIPLEARQVKPGRGEVTGEVEIPWVSWGLQDPSNFVLRVEKTLTVRFRVAGALQEP